MAAIKREKNAALAALTTAALGLPGIEAQAVTAMTEAQGNVMYGHYQESGNRMQVDVYHGDFVVPITDRLEFSYSIDRDTYSGATPAFSMPVGMTNQPKYKQNDDGTPASTAIPADVVSAASGGLTGGGLTILGGLNGFQSFQDARAASEAEFDRNNPRPPDPIAPTASIAPIASIAPTAPTTPTNPSTPTAPTIPTAPGGIDSINFAATINFQKMVFSSYAGKANAAPLANGNCPGSGSSGCYNEQGMVVGIVDDPSNPIAHLHRNGSSSDRLLGYHADSSGIYIRAQSSQAFSLNSMLFKAPIDGSNPDTGPNDYWQILGFNTALNPSLSTNPSSPTQVAYQTVTNGFNGTLTLDSAFQNINAFWIHYNGYPQTPADGKAFGMELDNVAVSPAQQPGQPPVEQPGQPPVEQPGQPPVEQPGQPPVEQPGQPPSSGPTPEQQAWEKEREKQVAIAQFRAVLNTPIPANTKIVQRYQEQPLETRTMPIFGAKYYLDNSVVAFTGGYSDEPDFHSDFGTVNYTHEFNDKHTTATLGYSYTSNDISRSTDAAAHDSHHSTDPNHNPITYKRLEENSTFNAINLSIAQVVSKNTLVQVSGNFTNQNGFLTNPYKYVYIRGEVTPEEYYEIWQAAPGKLNIKDYTKLEMVGTELFRENRPRQRSQGSVSIGISQHIPALDASVNADYRFFSDNWGINSHTFELKWFQPLPYGIMVTPNIRYYSQSQADFFAPYFLEPRADGFYSSDFRLSAYGALSGGITVSKKFAKGISLQAGFEYYTHASSLRLGGGGEDAYADFSYFVAHAGLNFNLSSPGISSGEHHHHHHHGAQPPAGVMFAHMMGQTNDIMVGYRYMFTSQLGNMVHGNTSISDMTLANKGCEKYFCLSRPTNMTMHMHMFELMYAPTDWLNLMVMPQLMDMDMNTKSLFPEIADVHAGGHQSHGLGDTIMMALVKVFDTPMHHLHAGVGVSAPTGAVDITMDGRNLGNEGSLLQDYGMQLGSGTWDFRPNLTYTGQLSDFSWGLQLSGIKRMEGRNSSGYALGDMFQTTAWAGYSPFNWLTATVRGNFTAQNSISGRFNHAHSLNSPVDFPSNYGGRFADVGFGLNLSAPDTDYAGHNLSVEWLQPVSTTFNGYQLERTGSLAATWTYSF